MPKYLHWSTDGITFSPYAQWLYSCTYHGDLMEQIVKKLLIVIVVLNGYVQLFMVKGHVHA